jgi:hypothetical protein
MSLVLLTQLMPLTLLMPLMVLTLLMPQTMFNVLMPLTLVLISLMHANNVNASDTVGAIDEIGVVGTVDINMLMPPLSLRILEPLLLDPIDAIGIYDAADSIDTTVAIYCYLRCKWY